MKQKLKWLVIPIIVIVALLIAGLFYLNRKSTPVELELPIHNFKLNDEYVFDGIPWGTELQEVKKKLPFPLEKIEMQGMVAAEKTELVDYRTVTQFILDGKATSTATFKFQNDKFVMAMLIFPLNQSDEAWYNTQLEKFIEHYGEASNIAENSNENSAIKTYRWDTEMTSLQWGFMEKSNGTATATLAVFYRYQG